MVLFASKRIAMLAICTSIVVSVAIFLGWVLLPYHTEMTPQRKAKYSDWAVVAGASEGLGAAWAEELASHGLNVLLIARSERKLHDVAVRIRSRHLVQVETYVADLMNVTEMIVKEKVIGSRGIGLFVFNAAYSIGGQFLSQPLSEHLKVSRLNVDALLTMTHGIALHMKERGHGGIILMGSMAGILGTGYYTTYSASKGFIASLSRTLWYEMAEHNVDVLGCLAGATTTPAYLETAAKAGQTRNTMIEQSPSDVVVECLAALGRTGAIATGWINKLSHALLKHLLPADQGIQFISHMTQLQTQADAR